MADTYGRGVALGRMKEALEKGFEGHAVTPPNLNGDENADHRTNPALVSATCQTTPLVAFVQVHGDGSVVGQTRNYERAFITWSRRAPGFI